METLLVNWGLPALFGVSFLAATFLPLASEWLLVALVARDIDLTMLVITATAGNTLGAVTTWAIGMWGGVWVMRKILRISDKEQGRAELWYARWGCWSLLLSWVPVVGDPLCLVGGLLKIPLVRFFLLVVTGKAARYVIVVWTAKSLML